VASSHSDPGRAVSAAPPPAPQVRSPLGRSHDVDEGWLRGSARGGRPERQVVLDAAWILDLPEQRERVLEQSSRTFTVVNTGCWDPNRPHSSPTTCRTRNSSRTSSSCRGWDRIESPSSRTSWTRPSPIRLISWAPLTSRPNSRTVPAPALPSSIGCGSPPRRRRRGGPSAGTARHITTTARWTRSTPGAWPRSSPTASWPQGYAPHVPQLIVSQGP
jgi:hypothetical protein